jgi:hypothetical protein
MKLLAEPLGASKHNQYSTYLMSPRPDRADNDLIPTGVYFTTTDRFGKLHPSAHGVTLFSSRRHTNYVCSCALMRTVFGMAPVSTALVL